VTHNKQLQRTVIRRRGRGACASFHCAHAPRWTRGRAAAELHVIRTIEVASISIRAAAIMVLTFALGIAPATRLVLWTVSAGPLGVVEFWQRGTFGAALVGLAAIPVIVAALFGYAALFYAAGDIVTPKVARWLVGGILANILGIAFAFEAAPMLLIVPGALSVLISPLVVGCAHLAWFFARAKQRRASV
jgi:hypothetical protein